MKSKTFQRFVQHTLLHVLFTELSKEKLQTPQFDTTSIKVTLSK